jgi:hypothetical protein
MTPHSESAGQYRTRCSKPGVPPGSGVSMSRHGSSNSGARALATSRLKLAG